jgi:hypothetical protein
LEEVKKYGEDKSSIKGIQKKKIVPVKPYKKKDGTKWLGIADQLLIRVITEICTYRTYQEIIMKRRLYYG